jgi:hypothetical protein
MFVCLFVCLLACLGGCLGGGLVGCLFVCLFLFNGMIVVGQVGEERKRGAKREGCKVRNSNQAVMCQHCQLMYC